MTTLADIMSEIADDIDDTTLEYQAQIKRSVQAAQRYCARYSFFFNETRDATFQTTQGKEWYADADNANISTLVRVVAAYCSDGSTVSELTHVHPRELEERALNASSGKPTDWTYFNQKIRLYPMPGATAYTIRLQLGPYRLFKLENPTDTNAWLDWGYDMLKARAKYIVYKDTLKDPALAAEALNDYRDHFDALKGETSSRTGTGFITPTQF